MTEVSTEVSAEGASVQKKDTEPRAPVPSTADTEVPSSGRRAAFRDVRRQLTDEDLSAPGAQKLLLEMLEQAEEERESLRGFVVRYHESDKKAAILAEKLLTHTAIAGVCGAGVGRGGAILGLSPVLGQDKPTYGIITAVVGLALFLGAIAGRIVKK